MPQRRLVTGLCLAGLVLGLGACPRAGGEPTASGGGAADPGETAGAAGPAPRAGPAVPSPALECPRRAETSPALLDPSLATEQAPASYTALLQTTAGNIVVEVHRDWAPLGADRFYNLVRAGFYDGAAFFRVVAGFMAQAGLSPDPAVNAAWRPRTIADDPVRESNTRGRITFATSGPDSRTTQFFISFGNNSELDGMGFAPFGEVRDMAPVDALHSGYGDGPPRGRGPSQGRIQTEGRAYLEAEFPELDVITVACILE